MLDNTKSAMGYKPSCRPKTPGEWQKLAEQTRALLDDVEREFSARYNALTVPVGRQQYSPASDVAAIIKFEDMPPRIVIYLRVGLQPPNWDTLFGPDVVVRICSAVSQIVADIATAHALKARSGQKVPGRGWAYADSSYTLYLF